LIYDLQESALRRNPDIVIATPGRLIDHLKNTPSFTLDSIEVLVLDEADRYVLFLRIFTATDQSFSV
jgi:superfamily II DNA/RNA helicase